MVSGAHLEVLKLVGRDKKVLDVGCAQGFLTRAISEDYHGVVDGVELDPASADQAKKHARRIFVGSIEDQAVLKLLTDKYDVILFADVLEHLRDPLATLKAAKGFLAGDGYVVASIPNVANWRVRFGLLFGRFEYQDTGLLDRGHLRLFTLKSVKQMFQDAGYKIVYLEFTLGEAPAPIKGVSGAGKSFLKQTIKGFFRFSPGLFANQFIIKAVKSE
jgi:O-antigen biosynthesis protein